MDRARRGAAIDNINFRKRSVGEFFVVPKDGRRGSKKTDVEAIVAALMVEKGDELIEAGVAAIGA